MSLWKVYENFIFRISGIVPTEQSICGKNQFEVVDKLQHDTKDSSGLERSFIVTFAGGGADLGVTDVSERDSECKVSVQVVYWPGRGMRQATKLILQDQWDIVQALRDDRNYDGYDADNQSTSTGIIGRHLDSWQIYMEDDAWLLEQTWSVHVRELTNG